MLLGQVLDAILLLEYPHLVALFESEPEGAYRRRPYDYQADKDVLHSQQDHDVAHSVLRVRVRHISCECQQTVRNHKN